MAEDDTEDDKDKIAQSTTTVPTNAGIVVAWIGIVFCWALTGLYAISLIAAVILCLMDCYNSGGLYVSYLALCVGNAVFFFAPVACLACMYRFKDLAKHGKWTSGACVVAVIVTLVVGYIVAVIISLVENAIGGAAAAALSASAGELSGFEQFMFALIQFFESLVLSIVDFGGLYEAGGIVALVWGGVVDVVITGFVIWGMVELAFEVASLWDRSGKQITN